LRWNIQRGISWIHGRGYHWFVQRYLPAIRGLEAAAKTSEDRELLSDAYYYVGDVYDFNEAPLAAIRAYKKSAAHDPLHAEAFREIGGRYADIGRYAKARTYLQHALTINADEPHAQSDLELVLHDLGENTAPTFQRHSLSWKIHEWFAQQKFSSVLRLLERHTDPYAHHYRMSVYGALQQIEPLLSEWKTIITTHESVTMRWQDWFYIQSIVWNSQAFWTLFLQGHQRFQHGVWWLHESLWQVVPSPQRGTKGSQADIKRLQKRLKLSAQFHLARICRDHKAAHTLATKFPMWQEARNLSQRLRSS
jgi:tetratricopeptide (TPR) repeat protein